MVGGVEKYIMEKNRMTKYLLILLFAAGMGMSSYAYTDTNREEEKKACDGGNLSGCYNLGVFVLFI
jgi:hypothetical protein